MSYILEALKKAQAERQLGNAPTIHAPTLQTAPAHAPLVKKSGVLALGAGAGFIVLVAAGVYIWNQKTPAAPVVPAATLPVAVAPAPAAVTPAAPAAAAAPVAAAPVAAAAPAEPVTRARRAAVKPVAEPAPPLPGPEDTIRYAKDLPQDIQQQLPRVGFGGYMYSDNAVDRLVLVDKTLRHEGEEIAPGLTLEKLLPRGAVLNFRGTRYRVAF